MIAGFDYTGRRCSKPSSLRIIDDESASNVYGCLWKVEGKES